MYQKIISIILISLVIFSCSKKEIKYEPKDKVDPYVLYNKNKNFSRKLF